VHEAVSAAYQCWRTGDVDGFLARFADDAQFVIPGSTRVSGDHDKAAFRRVLEHVVAVTRAGRYRSELVTSYESESGEICVFDNYVVVHGDERKYHSVHEWIMRDGAPRAWMLYVHEYETFQRVWA
jgi:ketosteroid isomerase-like protein